MNPPYQPPGPQPAFPQSMPPPDAPPNYQRSASSRLQLPAPRQLLQYADSYHHASSQNQPHHQHASAGLPPPLQPNATPVSLRTQHHQSHSHLQHQLPALNPSRTPRKASYANEPTDARSKESKPAQAVLTPVSNVDEVVGYKYQLDVIQQPKRARMCGFGDKDRRPITPPPCVRLSIVDIATGKEVNYNEIDHTMFVLNVDLWNADGTREVNLVRSSTATSSATSSSANVTGSLSHNSTDAAHGTHGTLSGRDASYNRHCVPPYTSENAAQTSYNDVYRPASTYAHSSQHYPQNHGYRPEQPMAPHSNDVHSRAPSTCDSYSQESMNMPRMSVSGGQPQGMFTRNLIGSVAVSAFNLCDTEDKRGIWFVLQDLSVRTEGNFRIRFSFVNVGPPGGRVPQDGNPAKVTTGRAPILASSYSEVFSVFSAKKFPGVCESTALSKTFAAQGIKIPIRKEAGKGDDEEGYGD
ncbi:nucleoside diphosphatase Gda1 [Cordyceps militaris]|uniref:Nucleoside diphosphatase Gda1 n=1 Tax=Cordyceps militaris TaxID=73501 RepID=A0A2H4SJC8_CORMI|nr:nucleoside diphosphatase Gda1 [Cordyceps militaris]